MPLIFYLLLVVGLTFAIPASSPAMVERDDISAWHISCTYAKAILPAYAQNSFLFCEGGWGKEDDAYIGIDKACGPVSTEGISCSCVGHRMVCDKDYGDCKAKDIQAACTGLGRNLGGINDWQAGCVCVPPGDPEWNTLGGVTVPPKNKE